MTDCAEKLLVRIGIGVLDKPMTRAQAQRYGEKKYTEGFAAGWV